MSIIDEMGILMEEEKPQTDFLSFIKDPDLPAYAMSDQNFEVEEEENKIPTRQTKDKSDSESDVQLLEDQMSCLGISESCIKIEDCIVKIEAGLPQLPYGQSQKSREIEEMVKMQHKLPKGTSKRDNNTILKPIFTKFKKLIRKHKPFKNFFEYRTYKQNKVSLTDFEKLFSYAEIKGLFHELKQLLVDSYEILAQPKVGYTASRMTSYHEYIDRIYSSLAFADDYAERMDILYSYRKHHSQLDQIVVFRTELIKEEESQKQQTQIEVNPDHIDDQ